MLLQYVTVLQGTLAPSLLVMALGALLTVGEGRDKPRSAHWRTIGLLVGLAGAIVFAALRASAVITQRTVVNFPTLIACVILDVLVFAVAIVARRIVTRWEAGHDAEHIGNGVVGAVGAASSAASIARRRRLALDVANGIAALAIAATTFRALPDVILRLTIFVEPGDPVFTSEMLLRALGFLLGAATAAVAALIFRALRPARLSGHRGAQAAFQCAALLLIALIFVQHATDLAQILQSKRLVVFGTHAFLALVWFINHQRWMVIAQAVAFAIPALASVVIGFRSGRGTSHSGSPAAIRGRGAGNGSGADAKSHLNQAQERQLKAFRRRAKAAGVWSLVAVIGITVALTYGVAQTQKVVVLSPPESYSLKDGVATIPFSQVEDGHLHRFEYKAQDGTVMRFIIIKKNGGAYGIGLDACENCGDAGYYEKDGKIICKKCDVAINLATIGFKGGCNPVPLPYKTGQGSITIQSADLDALSAHFQ